MGRKKREFVYWVDVESEDVFILRWQTRYNQRPYTSGHRVTDRKGAERFVAKHGLRPLPRG